MRGQRGDGVTGAIVSAFACFGWSDLARSIQVRRVSESAEEVSSSQIGAGLKQFGGTVRPKHAKALTIPIVPEAKGKTAYELERPDRPLFVVSEATGDPETVGVLGYAKKSRKGSVDARNADVRKQRLLRRRAQTVYPLLQRIKQRVYVCCVFQFFNSLL